MNEAELAKLIRNVLFCQRHLEALLVLDCPPLNNRDECMYCGASAINPCKPDCEWVAAKAFLQECREFDRAEVEA